MDVIPTIDFKTLRGEKNSGIIINTGDSGTIGEHWVAIKMTKHSCFYFDSFGLEILDENIKKFASNYSEVIYSNHCIQDYRSEKMWTILYSISK